jgi:hypothetical protein
VRDHFGNASDAVQAAGRSRGGFSTKIHLRINAEGLPIGMMLTSGEAHDVTAYEILIAEAAPESEGGARRQGLLLAMPSAMMSRHALARR